ncbi:MAG: hypothetical protein CMM18_00960 [Rhodospirillaceae bacterium]|nr:hypothetical protein [Rhodospirillaceae bacterium]
MEYKQKAINKFFSYNKILFLFPIIFFFIFMQISFGKEITKNALDKLKMVEEALEQNKIRGNELNKVKSELNQDIDKLRRTLIETSLSVMNQEEIVNNINNRINLYNSEESSIKSNLNKRKMEISKILTTLQRIQSYQLNKLQIKEDKILKDISISHILSGILPQITNISDNLKSELIALNQLKSEIHKEKQNLKSANEIMSREKIALKRLINRKSELRGKLITETEENKIKIKKLAKNAKNLKALIKKLGYSNKELLENNVSISKLKNNRFDYSKGKLPLPVKGRVKIAFGEKNKIGNRSKGLIVETITQASVITPHDGEIVYAGPFRNYGNLLIISYGNGYHILFSGLALINGHVGKWIMAGEPIGKMGMNINQTKPELYIELRKNGEPINPSKWIVTNNMKVRG